MRKTRTPSRIRDLVFLVALLPMARPAPAGGEAPAAPASLSTERYVEDANAWVLEPNPGPSAEIPPATPMEGGDMPAPLGSIWTFAPNTRVHPAQAGQYIWVDVAVGPSGQIGVAWMDDHLPGGWHIFYTVSTDGGATWSFPEKVDSRVTGTQSKFVDFDFTPSGKAVAVWEDDRTGSINLYYSKRDPSGGGTPWTPNVKVNTVGGSPSTYDFMNGSVAVLDEDRYFVAWTDWREGPLYQVYMRGTSNGGATWGPETRVSDELGYQPVAADACLIADQTPGQPAGQERLYCVTNDWRGNVPGGRYPNVYFYRSTNGGATWSVGVQANDIEPLYQQTSSHALVRVADGTLTAGWLNNTGTYSHFRTCVSTSEGATWLPSTQVDEPSPGGTGTYSSITTAGGWVMAVFDIYTTDWDLYFRASKDGGRTWVYRMERVDDDTTGTRASDAVVAAVSPAVVYAAWPDNRPPGFIQNIYFSRGTGAVTGVVSEPAPPGAGGGERLGIVLSPNPARAGDLVRLSLTGAGGADGVAAREHGARDGDGYATPPAPEDLRVFNAAGQVVRVLSAAGRESVWNGRAPDGRVVSPGVYLVRWRVGERTALGRIVLTR